VDHYKRKRIS